MTRSPTELFWTAKNVSELGTYFELKVVILCLNESLCEHLKDPVTKIDILFAAILSMKMGHKHLY